MGNGVNTRLEILRNQNMISERLVVYANQKEWRVWSRRRVVLIGDFWF